MPPFDVQKHPFDESLSRIIQNEVAAAISVLAKSVPCSVEEVEKNGTIVTVKLEIAQPEFTFPLIKCAVYGPQWVRWPIQKGDMGVMMCADYAIGRMTGMGKGIANMVARGGFSDGVFMPVGNIEFPDLEDGEEKKVVLYGPDGVILKTTKGDAGRVDVNENGVTIAFDDKDRIVAEEKGVTLYAGDGIAGNYFETTDEGFKFFVDGQLKFIIDAGGARYVGNAIPGSPGQTFGINTTPTGTHIDGINYLTHLHSGVTTGGGNSGAINTTLSPSLVIANEDEP